MIAAVKKENQTCETVSGPAGTTTLKCGSISHRFTLPTGSQKTCGYLKFKPNLISIGNRPRDSYINSTLIGTHGRIDLSFKQLRSHVTMVVSGNTIICTGGNFISTRTHLPQSFNTCTKDGAPIATLTPQTLLSAILGQPLVTTPIPPEQLEVGFDEQEQQGAETAP